MGRHPRKPLEPSQIQGIIKNILDDWSISLAIKNATGHYDSNFQKWILKTYPKVHEVYRAHRIRITKTAKMNPANAMMNNQLMKENEVRAMYGLEPKPLIGAVIYGQK